MRWPMKGLKKVRLEPNMSMYISQLDSHTEDGHFRGGAEVMTSASVVEVNQPFGSTVMWTGKSRRVVAMPHKRQDEDLCSETRAHLR
jgi:hypothetical protein